MGRETSIRDDARAKPRERIDMVLDLIYTVCDIKRRLLERMCKMDRGVGRGQRLWWSLLQLCRMS